MPHIAPNGEIDPLYPARSRTAPTVPLYPPPVEIANLVAEIAIRLQTDPGLIDALHIAELDIPNSDDALEAAQAAAYVLICAQAGFHPTLSIVDVTESHP